MAPSGVSRRLPEPTASSIVALLGPTNTGKTHRAVQRMLEHDSGMIGLPLRLLAREVYDRVSAEIGEARVALVTGEEKRVPRAPSFWVCTVEAMPEGLEVDFVAVDEVQLVAHPERGHVFTDRVMRSRGRIETWFLGADTARPLLAELSPAAKARSHPRLSRLGWAGSATLATLPPRSAVVAFGMNKVYELAERLRTKRGGAAVVLGALSPRARNAQVAMYQAGEVQYLVATDAIGMGLNLDVDHVAFAELSKFDGHERRPLEPAELAQIAGRAGRYVKDGTFGVLEPQRPLPEGVARAIEDHRFAPLRRAFWRSPDLDFSDVDALLASLRAPPRRSVLLRVPRADDAETLVALARDPEVRAATRGTEHVALLWDVCRIPDYHQNLPELHQRQVKEIYLQLRRPEGRLGEAFLEEQLERLQDTSGDIDDLLAQMARVRTWTYVTSHPGWVADAARWQETTRALEDRLSDALHQRLVQRFVDRGRSARRSGVSRARPSSPRAPIGASVDEALAPSGPFAKLMALRRHLADREAREPRGDREPVEPDVDRLIEARHEELTVDPTGVIAMVGCPVGRLVRGRELLQPEARATLPRPLGGGSQLRVERRLTAFARDLVGESLAPLRRPELASRSAATRGLLWQLERSLGSLPAARAREQIELLDDADRDALAAAGIVVGGLSVFAADTLRSPALARRFALVGLWSSPAAAGWPAPSTASSRAGAMAPQAWEAAGYLVLGPRAVRADLAERAFAAASRGERVGPLIGCRAKEEAAVIAAMGLASVERAELPR